MFKDGSFGFDFSQHLVTMWLFVFQLVPFVLGLYECVCSEYDLS